MNTTNRQLQKATTDESPLGQDILAVLRYWLTALRLRLGTRGLIVLATALIGAGLALNWSWVVAIGVAPIILAVLPCAAMCALGLCMMPKKGGGSSCSTQASEEKEGRAASQSRSSPPEVR